MSSDADPGVRRAASLWPGLLVLVAVAMLLFVRSLSPDSTLAQGDVSVIGMRTSYARAELPGELVSRWHSIEGMGVPLPGLPLALSTLIGVLVPASKSVDVSYLVHLLIFGIGGFMLLRDLTRSAVAATVGGLWFMLQPHVLTHMQPGHLGFFWGCAWMPWCIYFVRLGCRGGSVAHWVLAGACAGEVLKGATDTGILFLLFVAGYGFVLLWREGVSEVAGGVSVWRYWLKVLLKGSVAGVVCLVVSFQILTGTLSALGQAEAPPPAVAEAKAADAREREQWLWATQWSVPVEESLDFVIPGLFGWGSSHAENRYRGRIGQTEGFFDRGKGLPNLNDINNYLGATILLCCLLAVLARRRDSEVWYLAAAGVAACLLAFGKHAPFYRWFYEIPYMSSIRNPIKWFFLASLSFGMLGAIGLAGVLSRDTVLRRLSLWKRLAICFGPGLLVLLAGSFFILSIGPGAKWLFWREPEVVERAWAAVRVGVLFWVAAGAIFMWFLSDRARGIPAGAPRSLAERVLPWAAAVLVLVETLYVDLRYMPINPQTEVRSDSVAEFLNAQKKPFRIFLARTDGVYRYIGDILCSYYEWERPTVTVSRTEDPSTAFMRGIGDAKKWLQLANVQYVLAPGRMGDPDFVPVASVQYGNTPVVVHRFTNALPRYYIVDRWEVVAEDKALARLGASDFDPRRSVLLHAAPGDVPAVPTGPVAASCDLTRYSRQGATIRTQSSHPAVMVSLERFHESWAVFVDGKRAPMWKADWMLRACPIPAGEHEVEWRVVGDGGRGLWTGIAGWGAVVAALCHLAFRRWLAERA